MADTGAGRQRPWRILVVDDEQNLNWGVVASLRRDQYVADGALTGEEAIRRLTEASYDCVISDVKMPGMDGFDLLLWLRERHPQTRVIIMTAFGSPSARQEAVRGGVVAYLEKPFDLQTLKQELRRTLESNATPPGGLYDLTEVARVINHSRRDLALQVETSEATGTLRFLHGELIWAEAWVGVGRLNGDDAFLALCAQRNARVQQIASNGRADRNVAQPVARLLFLALMQRDGGDGQDRRTTPLNAAPTPTRPSPFPPTPAPPTGNVAPGALSTSSLSPLVSPSPGHTGPASSSLASSSPSHPLSGWLFSSPGGASQTAPGLPPVANETPSGSLLPLAGQGGGGQLAPSAAPAQIAAAQTALDAFAATLPTPSLVALLSRDGALIAQVVHGVAEAPTGAYQHLAQAAQAVARGALLADWGATPDLWAITTNRALFARRLTPREHTAPGAYLCAILPLTADFEILRHTATAHEVALLASLTAG